VAEMQPDGGGAMVSAPVVDAPLVNKKSFGAHFLLGPTDDSPALLEWQEVNGHREPDHSVSLIFAPVYSNPLRATVLRYVAKTLCACEASWFRLEENKWLVDYDALRVRFTLGDEFTWLRGQGFVEPEYDFHQAPHGGTNQKTIPWVTLRFERDTLQESFETEEQRRTRIFDRMIFHAEVVDVCRSLFVSGHGDDAIFKAFASGSARSCRTDLGSTMRTATPYSGRSSPQRIPN
jgi:hypothetical protein